MTAASRMTFSTTDLECARLRLQSELDSQKTSRQRNKLGQFATPTVLADEIMEYAREHLNGDSRPIRFLEPGFNTGSFYSALLRTFPETAIESAVGYEIDPHYGQAARDFWKYSPVTVHLDDFTKVSPPGCGEGATLLVCNPPYVRHHHLAPEEKIRLQREVERRIGIKFNGLSGLYCYFMGLSHDFMAKDALAGWLVPSEFLDVNYGRELKQYLLDKVTLLHIHRFDANDVQFADAYVSSAIVWFKNCPPPPIHTVKFTFGGTLLHPKSGSVVSAATLKSARKWSQFGLGSGNGKREEHPPLSSMFHIKRGLATGSNSFFILAPEDVQRHEIPWEFLMPILPSPRHLSVNEIHADEHGNPVIDRKLFLLRCDEPEEVVRDRHPALWRYLESGIKTGVNKGYLCSRRSPWYAQEHRPAAPLLCTYMGRTGRGRGPFRFILNRSRATAANTYLMLYPKPFMERALAENPDLAEFVWRQLNNIPAETMISEGRVYGGGLHKLEPKELGNTPLDIGPFADVLQASKLLQQSPPPTQTALF